MIITNPGPKLKFWIFFNVFYGLKRTLMTDIKRKNTPFSFFGSFFATFDIFQKIN